MDKRLVRANRQELLGMIGKFLSEPMEHAQPVRQQDIILLLKIIHSLIMQKWQGGEEVIGVTLVDKTRLKPAHTEGASPIEERIKSIVDFLFSGSGDDPQ